MKIQMFKEIKGSDTFYMIYKNGNCIDTCLIRPEKEESDIADAERRFNLCVKNATVPEKELIKEVEI